MWQSHCRSYFLILGITCILSACGCNFFYTDDFYRTLNPKRTDDYVLIRDKVIAQDTDFFERAFRLNPALKSARAFGFNNGTILYYAYENNKLEIAHWFLAHGVDPNIRNSSNDPSIVGYFDNSIEYTESEDLAIVDEYLAHGGNLNAIDGHGRTLLGLAFQRTGSDLLARHLLELGADPWAKSILQETQVHFCVRSGNLELTQRFLDKMTLAELREITSKPFLLAAAASGNTKLIEIFLELGEDINEIDGSVRGNDSHELNTALHEAAFTGRADAIQFLIKNGAEVDRQNAFGETPLIIAAKKGYVDATQILLKYNASVILHDRGGDTPLTASIAYQHPKVTEILKQTIKSPVVDPAEKNR